MNIKDLKIGEVYYIYYESFSTIYKYEYIDNGLFIEDDKREVKLTEIEINLLRSNQEQLIARIYKKKFDEKYEQISSLKDQLRVLEDELEELTQKHGYLEDKYPEEFI